MIKSKKRLEQVNRRRLVFFPRIILAACVVGIALSAVSEEIHANLLPIQSNDTPNKAVSENILENSLKAPSESIRQAQASDPSTGNPSKGSPGAAGSGGVSTDVERNRRAIEASRVRPRGKTVAKLDCPDAESPKKDQKKNPTESGRDKQLPSIKAIALGLKVRFMDGNPLFFQGNESAWDKDNGIYPTLVGPNSIDQLNVRDLEKLSEERIGVAADGVSQLVVALKAPVEGVFSIDIPADATGKKGSSPVSGKIELLRQGKTCAIGEDHLAFAVYTAPTDFGRRAERGPPAEWISKEKENIVEARTVQFDIQFKTPSGVRIEEKKDLKVVRPPVVLVHGAFDDSINAWLTRSKPYPALPYILKKAGFVPFIVDYQTSSGRGRGQKSSFWDNRYILWTDGPGRSFFSGGTDYPHWGGIRQALVFFRDELNIAATRADVIGHSMGGVLARVYASDWDPAGRDTQTLETLRMLAEKKCPEKTPYNPDFRRPDNFGQGDINRIMTLGTPHHGSGQPEIFELITKEDIPEESMKSYLMRTLASHGVWWMEAISAGSQTSQDLKLQSCALRRIGGTQVPSHVVVGVTAGAGQDDPVHGSYLLELELTGALFYLNPGLLDKLFETIAMDWKKTDWEDLFPRQMRENFQGLIDSEYENWIKVNKEFSDSWLGVGPSPHKTSFVPYSVLEALRMLMFRFDDNDSTVRVDSQLGGLNLERDQNFITYVNVESDSKEDVKESVLHRFEPRYMSVQQRIAEVLRADPQERFAPALPPAGQRMPGKKPPEWIRENWQITGTFAKKWSGMDFEHADAFLKVANKEKVVIMTRPVNPDATELILNGNATKSMNVKGKSSNWGPQKGYIPVKQRYSKLWRTGGEDRDAKIKEFDEKNRALLDAKKEEYQTEDGKPIAISRQLQHKWENRVYSVWINPDEEDAGQSVYMCRGKPAMGEDEKILAGKKSDNNLCGCEEWLDWRTETVKGKGRFNLRIKPAQPLSPRDCKILEPLEVLADNTHPDKPFLTADYDILTTGFFCPKGKSSVHRGCKAEVKVNKIKDPKSNKCKKPAEVVSAKYGPGKPPDPFPCFDPRTGLIAEAQKTLLEELNQAVEDTGYKGGNVSHHGPETQFFESPYVDYPITVFDPAGPKGEGEIVSIPKGPNGFRDLHLKRYFEKKIREGFWLYPNTYESAKWLWMERNPEGTWQGWHAEDNSKIKHANDVEEIEMPDCVQAEVQRLSNIRRNRPAKDKVECEQARPEQVERKLIK